MKKNTPNVIYYRDELNDEFSTAQITPRKIDSSYVYNRDKLHQRIFSTFIYRCVAIPVTYLYMKIKFGHKIINRRVIKPYKNKACFIYGNHTQAYADPCVPTFITFPHKPSIIVHPNNVSIPVIGKITPYLGAIPLPGDMGAGRNFIKCIEERLKKNQSVCIYPEAHIWPYHTGIRNFKDTSFHYPVKYNTPVFCFTNTYQKRKLRKTPKMVTYIDGPFFADDSLNPRLRKTDLRDRVLACMKERAKNSNVTVTEYIKEENTND